MVFVVEHIVRYLARGQPTTADSVFGGERTVARCSGTRVTGHGDWTR
jgi:hypothetical protein